jgi:hypothetical protein
MKFAPYSNNKDQNRTTFATVKDYIIQEVQKNMKHGQDMAESLPKMEMIDLDLKKLIRKVSTANNAGVKQLEQDGFDLEYKAKLNKFLERKDCLEQDEIKKYILIMSEHCTKTMQDRVKEHPDFKIKIQDDPIELLRAINVLMHVPVRGRYPFAALIDVLMRLIFTKQDEKESLVIYLKRFK